MSAVGPPSHPSPHDAHVLEIQRLLDHGSWAEVIAALRALKSPDEMETELCASRRALERWEAGGRLRPSVERALRAVVREWLSLDSDATSDLALDTPDSVRQSMLDLADRVERSPRPDLDDFLEACSLCRPRSTPATDLAVDRARGHFAQLCRSGAWLEAAALLVPKGLLISTRELRCGAGIVTVVVLSRYGRTMWTGDFTAMSDSSAQALCAAALRARASDPSSAAEGPLP